VKGNKENTEQMLMEARRNFIPESAPDPDNTLFADFMLQ
jgi:hypothetical protein